MRFPVLALSSAMSLSAVRAAAGEDGPMLLREGIPVEPHAVYLLEGWIRASNGEARLEVEVREEGGTVASRAATPPVRAGGEWTYASALTEPMRDGPAGSARTLLSTDGKAEARDVQLVPFSPRMVANGSFESPIDGKGRIPFWSEEKDGALIPGKRGGTHRLDPSAAREGKSSLFVSATGDWHGMASVNYPVPSWSDRFEVSAEARSGPGARTRLLAVWSDDGAQRVIRVDATTPGEGAEWRRLSTGPLEPPPGARALRAVLVASGTAWFDDARISTLPPRQPTGAGAVRVTVNQVGYEAGGPKSAVVMTSFFPGESVSGDFEVLDSQGRPALRQRLHCAGRVRGEKGADWGWYFWRADFSSLSTEGRYRARASIGGVEATSFPFAVERDLLFRETAPPVVDFFFVQRCGGEVPGWHAACHLDDARLPDGSHLDLAGGWHSAGDYNKITWEYGDGGAVYALSRAAAAAPEFLARFDRDRDGLPDVLDEAWWGARYLSRLQTGTGAFLMHIQQGPDRQAWMRWVPPEKQTDNIPGTADDPVVLEGAGNSPLAAGGWARLSGLLRARGRDSDYEARARRAWERSRSSSPTAQSDPLLLLSTLELWRATKDPALRAFLLEGAGRLLEPPRLGGGYGDSGDIPAAALALVALEFPEEPLSGRVKAALAGHLVRVLSEAANPFGVSKQKADREGQEGYFFEPSSAYGQNFLFACRAWSALCLYRLLGDRRALSYAADHLDFILGKNPYGLCMLEGKGSFNPPRYHHRYDSIPGRERGAVPGAIPNGFVRDSGGEDRPGFDLSEGGRSHPSYRTSEPWLVHDVFFLLAVTALHEAAP